VARVRELLGHFASLGRFIAQHERRAAADSAALAELSRGAAQTLELPRGLELEWLGTAGYRLTFAQRTLYVDPYVSRVSLGDVLRRRRAIADETMIERWLGPAGDVLGVLVGHTHFDHAVDAPAVAKRFRCPAHGSSSLAALMRLHGVGELAVEVEPYRTYELGPFAVSFTPSLHSKLLLGLAVPFDGELTCDHLDALSPAAYRCGQVWGIRIEVAGVSFYHQGSANLLDDAIRDRGVDYFLSGVAGRGFTRDFWPRILKRLEPRVVVPTHYDDFFRPLADPDPGFTTNVNLAKVPDEVRAVSRDFTVAALTRIVASPGR
jgi:L-ascorbate metabolism protein UlaG (beta-lactamase superfamily)